MHYRGIHILSNDFNLAFGKLIIPCLKLVLVMVFILASFAMVRLRNELDGLNFAFVLAVTVTTLGLILPISMIMSSLYDSSSKFQQNMLPVLNSISDEYERNLVQHQVRSCPLIRCQVGNLYHMEAKAKLTLLQHVVSGVVFLLVNVRKV